MSEEQVPYVGQDRDKAIIEEVKRMYTISIHGCDDSTIFDMELTQAEFSLLERVADRSDEVSTYGCMPTLWIEEKTND